MIADPTPTVYSRYGAPMGRPNRSQGEMLGKVYLRRIRINGGGYDRGGAYWGLGAPLWYAIDDEGEGGVYFRARDRDSAKAWVLARHPLVRFAR